MIYLAKSLKVSLLAVILVFTVSHDTFAQQFDVSLTKTTITVGAVQYGTDIPFNLTISNNGTDTISNILLRDVINTGYSYDATDNPGWTVDPANPDARLFTYVDKIAPGDVGIVPIILPVLATTDAAEWVNLGQIVSFGDRNGVDVTSQDVDSTDNEDTATTPIVDVALKKELLTTGTVAYGDTLTFMTTVYNQGNAQLSEVTIRDYIPEGYDNPVDVNVALGWSTAAVNPEFDYVNLAPGDSAVSQIRLVLTMNMVDANAWDNYSEVFLVRDAGGSIVFTDADSTPNSNTAAERTIRPGDVDDNYIGNTPVNSGFQDDHDPAGPVINDLALRKERLTGPSSYSYGQAIQYSIDILNQGNTPLQSIVYRDSLPCGIEDLDLSINPGWSYDPTSRIATKTIAGPIVPASFDRDTLNLTVRPCDIDQYSAWTNVVEISEARDANGNLVADIDSQADTNFSNDPGGIPVSPTDNIVNGDGVFDEDDHDVEAIEIVDIAIRKTVLTPGPYAEGDLIDFNIRVFNQGNVEATETYIEEFVPIGFTYSQAVNGPLGWNQPVTLGATTVDRLAHTSLVPLAAGDSTDILLQLTLNLDGENPEDWYNYAHVLISRDSLGNNRFDDADSNPFTETEEERQVIPGGPNDDNILSMGVNADDDQDDHDPAGILFFDLSLEKIGSQGPYQQGQEVDFGFLLTNEGNTKATNIDVIDYVPCGFTFVPDLNAANQMWQLDNATGNVTFSYTDTLDPGDLEMLALTLVVTSCIEPGAYTNAAEITSAEAPDGLPSDDQDSTPDNIPDNDAPDEDDFSTVEGGIIDLSLSKTFTTPPSSTTVGSVLQYTIAVTNEGTLPAANVVVTDYLPCGLTFTTSAGWSTVGDNIEYTIPGVIAAGETVSVPLELTVGTCMGIPEYTNTAEISELTLENGTPVAFDFDSTPDSNPTNDLPGEDDIDSQPFEIFDLALSKSLLTTGSLAYGQDITYQIVIANEGTIAAETYSITEYLPCGLSFAPAQNPQWQQDSNTGYLVLAENMPLAPQATATYQLTLTVVPCATPAAADAWSNTAEISAATDSNGPATDQDSTPDADPNNDPAGEDDIQTVPLDIYDLSLAKVVTSTATEYEEGDEVSYEIAVTNEGNQPIGSYTITDRLPCGLALSPSSVVWTDNGGGVLTATSSNVLQPGQTATFDIVAVVVECANPTESATNVAEITGANDTMGQPIDDIDSTPDNNDPDEDDQDDATVTIVTGAVIGDFVFEDIDGDGVQDFGEPGIPGVTVTVYNDDQQVVTTLTTDANGAYEVELPTGDYYIVFDAGTDFEPTLTGQGSPATDSNVTGDFGPGSTSLFTVVNGVDDFTVDAGFYRCVTIRGIAWYDVNENDIREEFENGINGLTVNLYRNIGGSYEIVETQLTRHDPLTPSDDGMYNFCVSPGTYYVEVVMPPYGLVRVRPFVGGSNNDSDINNSFGPGTTPQFSLVSGQSKTDLGAGYYPMATVATSVWHDENHNGLQEDSEPAMANIAVQVYNEDHQMIAATVTNEDGEYLFDYLEKQSYYLRFEAPEGFSFTDHIIGMDTHNSDVTHANGANTTALMSLQPGQELDFIDAGLRMGVLPVTWVSVDATNHGKQNTVTWTTAQELNSSHYEVEGSSDGNHYEVLQRVESEGSKDVVTYTIIDEKPLATTTYYRIKHLDIDGQYSYSDRVVAHSGTAARYSVYPNPTDGGLTVSGLADEGGAVTIIATDGRVVLSQLVGLDGNINVSHLPAGIYYCQLQPVGEQVVTIKLVKL